ncbi:MAG: thymidylate synthase [Candidatus Nanohaloarchaea archaeon]|nr:thymidylate synthase [Candidatus Nanohaloarchaea archaeon]
MQQYLNLVEDVITSGTHKPNRTDVDTISRFHQSYRVDLQHGFPLLTTKDLSGGRWNTLVHELLWYLSGQEHIRDLQEETSIWDAWADENGMLETAYGRFWRRFPLPEHTINGEAWPDRADDWVNQDDGNSTFDQLQYAIDQLRENPSSRRIVVSAWHPANAAVSRLPPCHYSFVLNVQNQRLNLHLTQRSGDIAVGVPFNIAAYSLLIHIIAQKTDLEPGVFAHSIVDAHIYCGKAERGKFYADRLPELQERIQNAETPEDYLAARDWLEEEAPDEAEQGYDHLPNLLTQLSREPLERPSIAVNASKPLDELEADDIELSDYNPHDSLRFSVAE